MGNVGSLQLTAQGDREIVITRLFDAPRALVFNAFTKPELVKRWLIGPPGWSMPVCEIDLKVGGAYHYVWRSVEGREMGMRGVYREIAAPEKLVATEKFDDPWYPGEAVVTIALSEQGERTTLKQTILYETRESRDMVLKSPMEKGLAASYVRLADLLRRKYTMIDTPTITHTEAQMTALIHLTILREEIANVIGPGLGELYSALAAQGIAPAGPWLSHHLRMDPGIFDFEICIPVATPVTAVGRVKPGQLPAAKVARTVYHGDYAELGAAWGELHDWIESQGHKTGPDLWECYISGPDLSPDPATWTTQLNQPLID